MTSLDILKPSDEDVVRILNYPFGSGDGATVYPPRQYANYFISKHYPDKSLLEYEVSCATWAASVWLYRMFEKEARERGLRSVWDD